MNSQEASTTFHNLVSTRAAYIDAVTPYKERFYSFLHKDRNKIFAYPVDAMLPMNEAYIEIEDFEMSLNDLEDKDTIFFGVEVEEMGELETYYFRMPFAYMDDPDAWEAQALANFDERYAWILEQRRKRDEA